MDLEVLKKWVYKEFKIDLSAYKENQLHRRLLSLMSRVGVKSVDEYIKILKVDEKQRQKFLNFITINVTEFFRNPEIFQELEKEIKKNLLPHKNKIRIWSAACSTGAEPYSLAMIIDKLKCESEILATDIDLTILSKAQKGEYTCQEIKNIENKDLDKYFTKVHDKYIIVPKIRNNVKFKRHDLILNEYEKKFDLIVCRNVVIYFKQDAKNKIYKKFSESLNSGGLFFVGATESIYNYREYGFEKASTFIYKKL